ncbi:two-component system response regulator [Streptomyces albus subsp. albus]|nr:two-component system response regulator [Streptomyces albus subsp. albus]
MIRILLVHDSCLLRSALAALISAEPDIGVEQTTWADAHEQARLLRPRVCVADVDSRAASGPPPEEDLRRLAANCGPAAAKGDEPGRPLVALVSPERPGPLRRAYEARALGFVDKNAAPGRLLEAIRRVAAGERFIDASLGLGFLRAAHVPLTRRELSVLTLAAEGASIAEIAGSLHLSSGTVRNYMAAITRKTGARNRIDAIRISRVAGWV